VYFDFLGADYAPATLGLDRAIGGLGARTAMAEHVAVWHLEKPIRRGDRPDRYRLEQNIVSGISGHCKGY
jgi:hypothetical protein